MSHDCFLPIMNPTNTNAGLLRSGSATANSTPPQSRGLRNEPARPDGVHTDLPVGARDPHLPAPHSRRVGSSRESALRKISQHKTGAVGNDFGAFCGAYHRRRSHTRRTVEHPPLHRGVSVMTILLHLSERPERGRALSVLPSAFTTDTVKVPSAA